MISILGLVLGSMAVIILITYFSQAEKFKLDRLKDREELSTEEIYKRYFKEKNIREDIFISLWNELAETLELPKGKLRPTDSFLKELAPEKGYEYDDPLGVLPDLIKRKYAKIGEKADLSKFNTINDFIEIISPVEELIKEKK